MAGLGATPSRPVGAEDVRNLQSRAGHPRRVRRAAEDLGSDAPVGS
jgi:hypothetical protein